jgi:hypothetical protein
MVFFYFIKYYSVLMNSKQTLKIATIVAVTGAFMLVAGLVNAPAYAKITQTCDDRDGGDCPGSSSNPGKGHDEENVNSGNGNAPPGLNKDN